MSVYSGKLKVSTPIRKAGGRQEINDHIRNIVMSVGSYDWNINVGSDNSVDFRNFQANSSYPNLYLPSEDWSEKNQTTFDTVISYILFRLKKLGYSYEGTIYAHNEERYWKLRVRNSEVFRSEGEVKVVYDDDNDYQVGGFSL